MTVLPQREVEKSPNDFRDYRALRLTNGMKVLLVHDAETTKSAAAVCVRVGHFSDPDDFPGLAHFCEHLIFMGTDKYPDESSFTSVLKSHGGYSNACTGGETTSYYFDVASDHLSDALDRFAQFFIAPKFTESATDRELNAIESENAKNKNSDNFRVDQLNKLRANPAHPVAKFGAGNRATLLDLPAKEGKSPRPALLEFFDTYYSADQMTLAVVGKESLDELEGIVDPLFSEVPRRGTGLRPSHQWFGRIDPFLPGQPLQAFNVLPVMDYRCLVISWPVRFESEAQREALRESCPFLFISRLLADEGPRSLLSHLKRENLANSVLALVSDFNDSFVEYMVYVDLTKEGLEQRYRVLTAIFSFLELIRTDGVPRYTRDEVMKLSDIEWRFKANSDGATLTQELVESMMTYEPERAISGPNRVESYDDTMVQRVLDVLRPHPQGDLKAATPLVTVLGKEFHSVATQTEKWYGTRYQVEDLESHAQEWSSPSLTPGLRLPGVNPFIPDDLGVVVSERRVLKAGENVDPPITVADAGRVSGAWKIWHRLDDVYAQPKAIFNIQLVTPFALVSARDTMVLTLFDQALNEHLQEYAHHAHVAGLAYSFGFTQTGAELTFDGFNDKMPEFISTVAKAIATYVPNDETEFARLKDELRRSLASYDKIQPYQHASAHESYIMDERRFSSKECLSTLDSIEVADVKPVVSKVLRSADIVCLMQGNVRADEIPKYLEGVRQCLDPAPLVNVERPEPRLAKLPLTPEGCGSLLRKPEDNPENANSACRITFQIADSSTRAKALANLFASVVDDQFEDSLRTQQQLGYIVHSGINVVQDIGMVSFVVQSTERSPPFLTKRCLEFLRGFRQYLIDLPDSVFRDHINGFVDSLTEPERSLYSEGGRHWAEIISGQLKWDRRLQVAIAARAIVKDDLVQFFERHVSEGGHERRSLTIEVFGKDSLEDLESPVEGANIIVDEGSWRVELEKFPIRIRRA